ncbi:transposase, partial [Colletotrichum incanum]
QYTENEVNQVLDAIANGLSTKAASREWGAYANASANKGVNAFIQRNPSIKVQRSRSINSRRVNRASAKVIRDWFKYLAIPAIMAIKPANRYNIDKTGIFKGKGSNRLVLGRAKTKSVQKKQPGSVYQLRAFHSIPLLYIRTTNKTAVTWLKRVFLPQTAPSQSGQARLLILDRHGSHITTEFMWQCYINNSVYLIHVHITPFHYLLFLPPHTLYVLQPLDQLVFSPVKSAYRKELGYLSQWNDSTIIGKRNFTSCY